jgi:uncharacterized protein (TIGR02598 family)
MKRSPSSGFTLVEIVLALAIIATAFIAILGLLPAGLDASRQATDATIVATILDDLHSRVQHEPLKEGLLSFSPAFYDDRGTFLSAKALAEPAARPFYRAELRVGRWAKQPQDTSQLRPLRIELSWPVDPISRASLGRDNPKAIVTYAATTLTGADWAEIYPPGRPDLKYQARIEF